MNTKTLKYLLAALGFTVIVPLPAQAQWSINGNDISNSNSGNVGIGITTPSTKLHIVAEDASRGITNDYYINGLGGPVYNTRKARGTFAVPAAILAGDVLGAWWPSGYNGTGWNLGGGIRFIAEENFGTNAAGTYLQFMTTVPGTKSTSEQLRITGSGNVGIGITNPAQKLHVQGNARVTGDMIVDGNLAAKYQDVAEWVPALRAMVPGTVVVLDPGFINHVKPAFRPYDTSVAGVVSVRPGLILGEPGKDKVAVATTGRVKVKATTANGAIHIGDILVTSQKEGMAMRSTPVDFGGTAMHRPGTVVGKALEPLEKGEGEILVLLTLG